MQIGVIGLDSSHTLEFCRRFHDLHAHGKSPCRVSCCWDAKTPKGLDDIGLQAATEALRPFGVRPATTLDGLLSSVEAVMVLTVDGHRHFDLAIQALGRGLPTFIDKPLTCSAAEAKSLRTYSQAHQARCFSASSLRFISGIPEKLTNTLGRLTAVEATGPAQETAHMPGLWYYGCHTFELVDALWSHPGGLHRVLAHANPDRYHIEFAYRDGRTAVIGLDRSGSAPFRVKLVGERQAVQFTPDLTQSYDRIVASIARFFEGGSPPVPLENAVEIMCAIDSCHRSIAMGGTWTNLD